MSSVDPATYVALARLSFRRLVPRRALVALGLVALLFAARDWNLSSYLPEGAGGSANARAFTRSGLWFAATWVLVPVLLARACLLANGWRHRDRAWIAPRAGEPRLEAAAVWFGTWLAGLTCIVVVAALVEARVGRETNEGLQLTASIEHASVMLGAGEPSSRWVDVAPIDENVDAEARLRLRAWVAPGSGPSARVRFVMDAGGNEHARVHDVAGPTTIDLPLTEGLPKRFRLERVDEGAIVVIPSSSALLLEPCATERLASLQLALRLLLAWTGWMALAAGLVTVLRTGLAALLLVCLGLFAWSGTTGVLPGAGLRASLELVAMGIVPSAPNLATWSVALGLTGLALVAGSRAFRAGGTT